MMKKAKKFLCLLLAVLFSLTFAACEKKEGEEPVAVTVDEAEKVVESYIDAWQDLDFENEKISDCVTDNCLDDIEKEIDSLNDKYSNFFSGDGENTKKMTDFDYKIKSSEEKDGVVIVEVELTNKDYSFFAELQDMSRDERVEFLQTAVNDGIITVDEANEFLTADEFTNSIAKTMDKLSGGDTLNETIEFTVIKDGDDVKIDKIDDIETLLWVLALNIKDAL